MANSIFRMRLNRAIWQPSVMALGLTLLAMGGTSCAHATIAGTQVQDTAANRQVYATLMQAREALERRDAEALLALISPRYFEDNGTPDPHDDYGYLELREKLVGQALKTAQDVSVSMQVYDIAVDGDHAWADLRYTSRVRLELPGGRLWDSHRDFDRIEFVRENGRWCIVRGL